MKYVRALRDRFVSGVLPTTEKLGDKSITGFAEFLEPNVLKVGQDTIRAKSIIIGAGSRPILFDEWAPFKDQILTSDTIFEQEDFPETLAVYGMGVIGLELGQALFRLGVRVHAIGRSPRVGGLSDPEVTQYALKHFEKEFPFWYGHTPTLEKAGDKIKVTSGDRVTEVDSILACVGRRANVDQMGIEKLGVELNKKGIPKHNPLTMQIGTLPIFIAGDITGDKPILHEASDEGRIAGYNSVREKPQCFIRRTKLAITFSDPNIAVVGHSYKELQDRDFCTGAVSFEGQGRSLVKGKNYGLLHVYGDKKTGKLLGGEMIGPDNEHLAHLLAWIIQQNLSVFEALRLPFYHPVIEEGFRTALRELARKVAIKPTPMELSFCDETGVESTN